MAFDVSTAAAYAVLYSVLVFFTLLAMGTAGWLDALPYCNVTKCLSLHGQHMAKDYFLAARNSAGMWALALSYFASGMGAWVLYGSTELGATPELSWLGILGYSGASAFPAILIGWWLGPKIRNHDDGAFSTTDFGRKRYGRVMQFTIAAVSIFYMFIFIVAELTAVSTVFGTLTNNEETRYLVGISASLGAFTILYTTIAGLPASIVTDKFQGIIVAILVLMLTIVVSANPANHISYQEFQLASNWTTEGLMAAVTLFIAIACAELFNQSTWQRVWAAESVPVMRKGFLLGSLLVFILMMFFGVMGMIAYALDPESFASGDKYSFLAFFYLLEPLKNGWHILVLILVTALAASSIDSLQNGIASIFSHDLVKIGWNPTLVARIFIIAVNVPAIYLASKQFDVIPLFLVADIVCATSVFPVFLGLQTEDRWKILKAPTELGAFLGCLSGIATVLVNGKLNNAEGGVFQYFWLDNGAICALCGRKTMVSFIVTPAVSCVMTYIFSYLDILIRKDRARQPLIPIAFDKDDTKTASSNEEDGSDEVGSSTPDDVEAVADEGADAVDDEAEMKEETEDGAVKKEEDSYCNIEDVQTT